MTATTATIKCPFCPKTPKVTGYDTIAGHRAPGSQVCIGSGFAVADAKIANAENASRLTPATPQAPSATQGLVSE